jgi:hypothetical protein
MRLDVRSASIPHRENTLRTSARPDPSDASRNRRKLDDLDAPGPIYTLCIRLRALWGDFPVVVRVHLGALGKSARAGASRATYHRGRSPREGANEDFGSE